MKCDPSWRPSPSALPCCCLPGLRPMRRKPTLAAVKARGELLCGTNGQLPGLSEMDAQKQWKGFEVDFCRAVAAAVLGDATKVKFVPLTTVDRFDALRTG